MEVNASPVSPSKARKKARRPEKWSRNLAKVERYSSKFTPEKPQCNHKEGAFKCKTLTMMDIQRFHSAFYSTSVKTVQDAMILKYTQQKLVQRRRPKNSRYSKPKEFQAQYFVLAKKSLVRVCLSSFLKILQITRARVAYVQKKFFATHEPPKEARGGNHMVAKYEGKKESVMAFINKLKCLESHYCRGSTQRMYLDSTLSINKLFRMYNEQCPLSLQVKKGYFRRIFNFNYNLGFKSPGTDLCSRCSELSEKIKNEKDNANRSKLIIEKRVHKLRAAAFYGFVREKRTDMLTLSFDCQKNLPNPKVADQQAYYSRQLYLYNFTVVQGCSKDPLTPENVFSYCWTEDEFPKASNQIASAVFDRLLNLDYAGITHLRLIADGCGGQNKNSTIITMLSFWLLNKAPLQVKNIELIFPVAGHSYIPPDRVFGNIEKVLKKHEVIPCPNDYINIMKSHATIKRLGSDCEVLDWKKLTDVILKKPANWHFQFQPTKRFYLKRNKPKVSVLIRGETHYKVGDGKYQSVLKSGKSLRNVQLEPIRMNDVKVSDAKLSDVKNLLLKHYGEDWKNLENLNYYKKVLDRLSGGSQQNDEEMNLLCETNVEVADLYI